MKLGAAPTPGLSPGSSPWTEICDLEIRYLRGPSAIEHALRRRVIWTETTPPIIENDSLRLLLSDIAIIDADQTQYGSLILKESIPVTLLLKRDGASWRIFSLQLGRR